MASDVDIVNLALVKLGARRITTLLDNVKEARSANAIYALERDNELRAHIWNFSVARVQLAASPTPPPFGYQLAYPLPNDYLRVIQAGSFYPGAPRTIGITTEDFSGYKIEGGMVLTNLGASGLSSTAPGPLNLRYIRKIIDPTQFDSSFVVAFAMRMAMELAEDLTGQAQKRTMAEQEYKAAIASAIMANALELPPDPQPDNTWLLARLPG